MGRLLLTLLSVALPGLAQAPRTPPSIVTASSLPAALAGSAYSQSLAATGSTPITWSVTNGSLSAGLTLNNSTGAISGTPAAMAVATFTMRATNAFGTSTKQMSLTVNTQVSVQVAPTTATLAAAQTLSLAATVSGSTNVGVVWSLNPAVGAISASGIYTAPASIASAQNVTVTATSDADSTQSASAIISLIPVTISLTPPAASLTISQTQQFTATITGSSNTAVTWSLNPAVGAISPGGLYTAPTSIASAQNVAVTATSVFDPTKSASATISLVPVAVTLTPPTVSLLPSQSQTFTAVVSGTSNGAVTWSLNPDLGSDASTTTTLSYIAPSTAPSTQTVTIAATSLVDPSRTATAVITLPQTITVSVSPTAVSLGPSGTQQFTATVLGASNTTVTWSINPLVGTISSAGLYTAPSSILTSQTITVTSQSVAAPTTSASTTIGLNPPTATFTYYVDSVNGSDSNPGTLAEPWQTIAKVNATTLSPAQSVGFKCGGVWREMLTPGQSGSTGQRITFGAYGTGAAPQINGADVVTTWTRYATNIYSASVSAQVTQLLRNGLRANIVGSLGVLSANNQWYSTSGTLFLYSTTNPSGDTIEATTRNYGVQINGVSHLVFNSLAFVKAGLGLSVRNASDIVITDPDANWNSGPGLYLSNGGGNNVSVVGGDAHDNGGGGVFDANNIAIGGTGSGASNITIDGVAIYGSLTSVINIQIATSSLGGAVTNVLIENCVIQGTGAGIAFGGLGNSAVVHHNIITGAFFGIMDVDGSAGSGATALGIYANTIYGNGRDGIYLLGSTTTLEDNILYNNNTLGNDYEMLVSGAILTSDYNIIYDAQGGRVLSYNGSGETFTGWQTATGRDTHSLSSSPLLNNPSSGDFTLQSSSPAIGAGVYIPGVTTANPPNIGAY